MQQQFNPQNNNLKVFVGGKILPRQKAKVSVFDSSVQGGDAVWEGLRVYNGRIFCLSQHLQRLYESAKALDFSHIPSFDYIKQAIADTLKANNMSDGVHIRLTLTRGEKITSGMDPRLNQSGSMLIVLAEWKPPVYDNFKGISLVTAQIRRNSPQTLDSKIHHNNLLNNILAKIEANHAGADDALMLDLYGFVAETNATNIFMVKNKVLHTPLPDACLPGITRGVVLKIAEELQIPTRERNLTVSELYNADEVFITGTMGELTPVTMIDKRVITPVQHFQILTKLQEAYRFKTQSEGEEILF